MFLEFLAQEPDLESLPERAPPRPRFLLAKPSAGLDKRALALSLAINAAAILLLLNAYHPIRLPAVGDVARAPEPVVEYFDISDLAPLPLTPAAGNEEVETLNAPAAAPSSPAASGEAGRTSPASLSSADSDNVSPAAAASGSSVAAEATAGSGADIRSRLRPGFRDARLYVDPKALTPPPPPRPLHERLVEDARRAILADNDSVEVKRARELASRQITVFGRKITIFGDEEDSRRRTASMSLVGSRAVLPTDGREWEEREMAKQAENIGRQESGEDRIRAIRERVEAERRAAGKK